MATAVARTTPALTGAASSAVRTSSRTAPYTLRVRFTRNQLHLQLCISPPSSPLWRNLPQYAMPADRSLLPYAFRQAPKRSSDGQALIDVPPTLLHGEKLENDALARELGGRVVLNVSPGTVGFYNSKSRLPEAIRETCFTFFRQFNELIRRSQRGEEMPRTAHRPRPKGWSDRETQNWNPVMKASKPFVPPMPSDIEVVMKGWQTKAIQLMLQSFETPNAFELRRRVTQVRDETPIVCCSGKPPRLARI